MSLFLNNLKQSEKLKQIHMAIANVGARKISPKDDYSKGEWSLFAPNLTIYGFDADSDACELANAYLADQQINWSEKHIPLALSKSEGDSTLYVTNSIHCSSLYPPNESFIKRIALMNNGLSLDFTIEIETTTLDKFFQSNNIKQIDFLQVDVQGADLDVLQGAAEILKDGILGVQVEVEFSSLYKNQPLFSDIDVYLRKHGFTLFDLVTDDAWCRLPRACSPIWPNRGGQLLWADAIYLQDPLSENANISSKEPLQILKLACIADIIGFPDYTLELLEYLTIHYGEDEKYNFAPNIVAVLSEFPVLTEQGLDSLTIINNISFRL